MKKLLMLCAALTLTACTATQNAPDPGGASLTLVSTGDFKTIGFDPGSLPTTKTRVTLTGLNLAVNDASCTPVSKVKVVCELGPLKTRYALPSRGVIVVQVEYGRPDGQTYTLDAD